MHRLCITFVPHRPVATLLLRGSVVLPRRMSSFNEFLQAPATDPLSADQPAADPHAATAMRLEALGLLAGGVAHDFNNILAVIRANVELARGALDGRPPDVPVALSDLAEVDRAVERASELVRQLLAFGRRQRLTPEALDLNAVMRETLALVRVLVGDAVQVHVRPAADLPRVRADRPQIEQVLVSLVLNGRDAIADAAERAGTLTVTTRAADVTPDDAVQLGVARPGRYACLQVRDDGIGMDAATRARIFEPFFTTKAVDRGAGLGLAATWGIVRQSGGAIHVASEPGIGSTFTVYLPATEVGSEPTHATVPPSATEALGTDSAAVPRVSSAPPSLLLHNGGASPSSPASTARPAFRLDDVRGTDARGDFVAGLGVTVLLAEDDHAVRRATSRILRGAGYQVLEAGDGRSALALWRARAREIDVLLADLRMPHLRGDALARAVRTDQPGFPVVLMTGFGEEPLLQRAFVDGHATDSGDAAADVFAGPLDVPVLAKPFAVAELLGRVAASLAAVRGGS